MTSRYRENSVYETKNFYKRNYVKATQIITPSFYFEEDINTSGVDLDIIDELINSHINIAKNYSTAIISGAGGILPVTGSNQYSSINTFEGLTQFFIKQNRLTDLDYAEFESKILRKVGKGRLSDFSTSAEFREYLLSELLPSIRLNNPSGEFTGITSTSALHEYLITNLNWLYFLNVSGVDYDGYEIVADLLVNNLYNNNKSILLNDALKGVTEYIFKNFTTNLNSWFRLGILPTDYLPNLSLADTTYTSGLQQLDKLKTLIDIVYSPNYSDRADFKVKEAFENYLNLGVYLDGEESQGPFWRLLKGMSYAFSDYADSVDTLEILNDIKKCPDEYLPELANLLGWKLIGLDSLKWRLQLINAVTIYKAAGTKKALQFVLDSTFTKDSLDVSSKIIELWESYIPHLVYYALATESVLLKDFDTWTESVSRDYNVHYIPSSLDESVRCVTDEIMLRAAQKFRLNFWYDGEELNINDPRLLFNYRGRDIKVPPFEEYQYYIYQKLNIDIVYFIMDQLVCFGVPKSFADEVGLYIINNSLKSVEDISLGYSWLIFTSSVTYPPNWDNVILDISNKKVEYLPLWNGKSSHFKMLFENNDFDFQSEDLDLNTKEGFAAFSDLIDQFIPAHAVKQLYLKSSETENYTNDSTDVTMVWMNKEDSQFSNKSDTNSFNNYETSGSDLKFYKRGFTGNNIVTRESVNSITDSLMQANAIAAPRKSFRRRNYRSLLNTYGFYDRTGHNMPVTTESYVVEDSLSSLGFLPLGLIPSSQQYVPIPDYRNVPRIYSYCENLNSTSIYSGLTVSNTFPCRGYKDPQIEEVPLDSVDLYLWFGDSLAGGIHPSSTSALNTYYTEIKENVSGVYLFQPSSTTGPKFEIIKPGTNNDILQVSTNELVSAIGPDWTFGYELQKKSGRPVYIIKLALPNAYPTEASASLNVYAQRSRIINNSSVNDWSVNSTNELLDIYKNWIGSGIDILQNSYGDKVTFRGAVTFLGTNVILDANLIGSMGAVPYAEYMAASAITSYKSIKTELTNLLKQKNIYKGYPNWIWCKPDQRYESYFTGSYSHFIVYIPEIREAINNYAASEADVFSFEPATSILKFYDSIHYDGSSNLFLGSSLAELQYNTRLTVSKEDKDFQDYSIDRGQLDTIMSVMFQLGESAKYTLASAIVYTNLSSYTNFLPWKNVVGSLVNEMTYEDVGFPSNFTDFTNFKFGKHVHKLYKIYCEDFNRHKLTKLRLNLNGPNFLAHAYGSILRNSDLSIQGSAIDATTSTLIRVQKLLPGGEYFPSGGGGDYNASSLVASSFKFSSRSEIVNSNIVAGIQLIHTLGAGSRNYFSFYNLDRTTFRNYSEKRSSFVVTNNILKLSSKSDVSLPRIRFDLKNEKNPSEEGHPLDTNLLIPNHEFVFSLNAMLAAEEFNSFGNGTVGVLIHTGYENSGTWVFIPNNSPCKKPKPKCGVPRSCLPIEDDGYWEFVESSSLTLDNIKDCYSHKLNFKLNNYSISSDLCYADDSVFYNLNASDFSDASVKFNTVNKFIKVPEHYYKVYNQVHRKDQNYFIEVFLYPNQSRELYISKFNLLDKTLNDMCKYVVSGTNNPFPVGDLYCQEYSFKLTREQLYHIFKYFAEITGSQSTFGKASRIASVTEDLFEVSGGSRLNYRIDPKWATSVTWNNIAAVGLLSSIIINN